MTDFSKIRVLDGKLCKFDVVHQLVGGAISGDDNGPFTFHDGQTPPNEEQIQAVQTEYDAKQYQRTRATNYPRIQEQLDMQYHDAVNGTTTWKDWVKSIKDAHPKP